MDCWAHTHTHTHLTALCPGLPRWAGTRKVKPIWISLKHETMSGSGIRWAICKSAPRSRQITTPAPHRSVFLQAGCPSCRPTNSVKALKAGLLGSDKQKPINRAINQLTCLPATNGCKVINSQKQSGFWPTLSVYSIYCKTCEFWNWKVSDIQSNVGGSGGGEVDASPTGHTDIFYSWKIPPVT